MPIFCSCLACVFQSRKQLPGMCALQLPSRKLEVELTTLSSNYHVEINPSDVGNNDRYVVQEIIKVGTTSSSTGAGQWGFRLASTALACLASLAGPPWPSTPTQCLLQHEQVNDTQSSCSQGAHQGLATAVRRNLHHPGKGKGSSR